MQSAGESIVLIGMMGAGKSSAGALLSERLGLPCVDLDRLVEERAEATIAQIFARGGEAEFRELEAEALAALPLERKSIVVTGGGIIQRPENRVKLEQLGKIVWLDADEEVLFERATRDRKRPLLKSDNPRQVFAKLYRERQSLYAESAEFRVDTAKLDSAAVADRIIEQAVG